MAHLNIKLLTYVGLTLVSLIFYISGVASSVFESKSNAGYTVTLFAVCPKAGNTIRGCYNVQWNGCKALHNARNASAAFEILAILTTVAALVIGCIELFREPIDVKLFGILRVRTIVSIVAWLFALFGWAIAVSLFTAPHCGQPAINKDSSARMGANQPLFIVGWLFMLVSFFTSCLPFSGEILVKSSTSAPH